MKEISDKEKRKSSNAGFALIFASLVGSLILAIGIALLGVTIKQITLAQSGRESHKAFYAADSALECALYLDRGAGFPQCPKGVYTRESGSTDPDPGCIAAFTNNLRCGDYSVKLKLLDQDSNSAENEITIGDIPSGSGGYCATAVVQKNAAGAIRTIVETRGLNRCSTVEGTFERAIRSEY